MYFLRCLQVETSSLRLFSVTIWGFDMIKYFSSIHKLHRLPRFEYALAFARIFHDIVNCSFFSFSSHKYLLSLVSLCFFSCLNDIWWLRHLLVLNSVAVSPTCFFLLTCGDSDLVYFFFFANIRLLMDSHSCFYSCKSLCSDLAQVGWLSFRWLYCACLWLASC